MLYRAIEQADQKTAASGMNSDHLAAIMGDRFAFEVLDLGAVQNQVLSGAIR